MAIIDIKTSHSSADHDMNIQSHFHILLLKKNPPGEAHQQRTKHSNEASTLVCKYKLKYAFTKHSALAHILVLGRLVYSYETPPGSLQ